MIKKIKSQNQKTLSIHSNCSPYYTKILSSPHYNITKTKQMIDNQAQKPSHNTVSSPRDLTEAAENQALNTILRKKTNGQ